MEAARVLFDSLADSARDSDTRTIYLLNFDDKEKALRLIKHRGAATFITKPLHQKSFFELVYNLLAHPGRYPAVYDDAASAQEVSFSTPFPKSTADLSARYAAEKTEAKSTEKEIIRVLDKFGATNCKRILIADDNNVMQKLAYRQIKKLGFSAVLVSNGREVLEAIKRECFGAILMDCQMPVLDGFEVTRMIRTEELLTGKHIPIIALTASAMKGDREDCLAAGMDDYLCKPVDRDSLKEKLLKWCDLEDAAAKSAATVIESNEPGGEGNEPPHFTNSRTRQELLGIFNLPQLEEVYGANYIPELLHSFAQEGQVILTKIRRAFEEKDPTELKAQAHQFKGMASVMTATVMEKASLELELAARVADWPNVQRSCTVLSQLFEESVLSIRSEQEQQAKSSGK
jgi:CheY-like chemotaxis protein/HPt (histidine-containing phosphotransfer) domain-containing protein